MSLIQTAVHPDPWQCPSCGTVWSNRPDTSRCQHIGCDVVQICEDCRTECSICSRVFCRAHIAMLDTGPMCRECLLAEVFEAVVAEDLADITITEREVAELMR